MKNYLYILIANTINSECKCFQVQNIFQRQLSAITVSGRIESAPCRAMTLRICRKTPAYKKGLMWHISEFELDRAVTSLKRERTDFRRHLKAESFTKEDVADIIRVATYGVVRLTYKENKIKKTKAIR